MNEGRTYGPPSGRTVPEELTTREFAAQLLYLCVHSAVDAPNSLRVRLANANLVIPVPEVRADLELIIATLFPLEAVATSVFELRAKDLQHHLRDHLKVTALGQYRGHVSSGGSPDPAFPAFDQFDSFVESRPFAYTNEYVTSGGGSFGFMRVGLRAADVIFKSTGATAASLLSIHFQTSITGFADGLAHFKMTPTGFARREPQRE